MANGFVRELVSLCAVILAIPVAGVFYDDMYPKVSPIIANDNLAALVSFISILAGVIIGGQVVAHLLKRAVAILNLGTADRLAGGVFGFLKAAVDIQAILISLVAFFALNASGSNGPRHSSSSSCRSCCGSATAAR